MVPELVARPVRIYNDHVQRRLDEGRVVVAAVPDDHVRFLLGEREHGRAVDAGEDDVALREMGLVLLALLDRALGRVEIRVAREALDGLPLQVAVGHRVADDRDAVP